MSRHDFLQIGTSFPRTDGTRAFKTRKLSMRDLFAKMPMEFKKWLKYPCYESALSEKNFGISNHQVRYLNINFGVILTLSKKVVQFTQTEETEGCE